MNREMEETALNARGDVRRTSRVNAGSRPAHFNDFEMGSRNPGGPTTSTPNRPGGAPATKSRLEEEFTPSSIRNDGNGNDDQSVNSLGGAGGSQHGASGGDEIRKRQEGHKTTSSGGSQRSGAASMKTTSSARQRRIDELKLQALILKRSDIEAKSRLETLAVDKEANELQLKMAMEEDEDAGSEDLEDRGSQREEDRVPGQPHNFGNEVPRSGTTYRTASSDHGAASFTAEEKVEDWRASLPPQGEREEPPDRWHQRDPVGSRMPERAGKDPGPTWEVPRRQDFSRDPMEGFTKALVDALKTQNTTTERFIARQSRVSKLPDFSGNPLDWPLFVNNFRQSTKDCGFTEAAKTNRLIQSLKGEAYRTVQALLLTPENASAAMARLEERYGRPEFVIHALMETARKCPAPKEGKLSNILDYSIAVSNLVTTIQALNQPSYLQNPQLLKELVDKLPENMKFDWGTVAVDLVGGATLGDFSHWIGKVARVVSHVTMPKFVDKKKGDGVFVAVEETSGDRARKCLACNQTGHGVPGCPVFKGKPLFDRWKIVRKGKLCFCCLKGAHLVSDCRGKKECGENGCKTPHHKLLHGSQPKSQERNQAPVAENPDVQHINGSSHSTGNKVLLKVIPITLVNNGIQKTVNAILDDCSSATLITDELARELQLTGPSDPLTLKWTNGASQKDYSSRRVSCAISPYGRKTSYPIKDMRTVRDLKLPVRNLDVAKLLEDWPHLKLQKFHYLPDEAPQILIGQPNGKLITSRKLVETESENSPLLSETLLGWCLHGPISGEEEEHQIFSCFHEADDDLMSRLLRESFQLEAVGVTLTAGRSRDDIAAEAKMDKVTRRIGDKFETGLLWRNDDSSLPPSREVALRRFMGIERKLERDPLLKDQYKKKLTHYMEAGYARKLTEEELQVHSTREWYLPHFATTHPNKPGKIRIVFDAAAKSHGVSLNDFLLTGPDLLNSLPGILINFRQKRIGFGGDITEMFHQVRICPADCPAQRFLWRDKDGEEPSTYQLEVMMFGSVCSPYCAQFVLQKNAKEQESEFPGAAAAVVSKHYMDDYVDCADDEEEAIQKIRDMKEVHVRGGFEIGKWISNSAKVLEKVQEKAQGFTFSDVLGIGPSTDDGCGLSAGEAEVAHDEPSKNLSLWSEIPTERTLGLHWNPKNDSFTYKFNRSRAGEGIATGEAIPTKRDILRLVMLIWDPLGFLAHFLITPRILLQNLWRIKVGWDDEIPKEYYEKWKHWIEDLPKISHLKIPRCYSARASSSSNIQLHIFADSSESAYCCAAYLRIEDDDGVDVILIMGKSRVAPLKPCSIPRLELQAALIATRMGNFIHQQLELEIKSTHYWTDSCTVLKWIRSEARRFHVFVANRVGEIHENSKVEQWNWVPSKENVADEGTRDGRKELNSNHRWWCGPDFLKSDIALWPAERTCPSLVKDEELELRKDFAIVAASFQVPELPVPNLCRFSKWTRLLGAMARILKFKENLLKKVRGQPRNSFLALDQAELHLCKAAQWESYPEDMAKLGKGETLLKSSPLYKLSPILDSAGVLRMNSRVESSPEEFIRRPIILSARHPLTHLLISYYHQKLLHQGEDAVRNELRQKFYVVHLRSTVRKVISSCNYCKLKKARAAPPVMGAIPDIRISPPVRAFTVVGMDYFGPMEVTIGRRHEKRYGVLFTCMNSRAVHLEIAHSLTTDSCIMAIRRLIGRRGDPCQIFSDNGTNLRGAERELRESLMALDQEKLDDELAVRGIEWHFLPPGSPHMTGVWERLVRSVKTALGVILKSRAPKEEVLQTLFAEAEAVVNSRPLTEVPVDSDSPAALTPFHFLIGTSSTAQPPGEFPDEDLNLRKTWRQAQVYANLFWRRWLREYIPTLQRRKKWHDRRPSLEPGDVVVVLDETLRRGSWPLGIITEVYPGKKDGVVRVAEVKTSQGTYQRPVVKLAKLDIIGMKED